MHKFHLNFVLTTGNASADAIKSSLLEFGQDLEIVELEKKSNSAWQDFNVSIKTEDPTIIFDLCADFGRIKSVKIN